MRLTLVHLELDQLDCGPRILFRVVSALLARLGLDLLLEPLLSEPLERGFERRAARVLVNHRSVDHVRVDELL